MTGDLIIIKNTSLRDVFTKGPKYREPKSINWKYEILMDFVEDYARQWVKREKYDLLTDTLSELMKSVRSLIQIGIKKLNGSMSTRKNINLKDPNIAKHMSLLHDKYAIVSADKSPSNIGFVCKSHYGD